MSFFVQTLRIPNAFRAGTPDSGDPDEHFDRVDHRPPPLAEVETRNWQATQPWHQSAELWAEPGFLSYLSQFPQIAERTWAAVLRPKNTVP